MTAVPQVVGHRLARMSLATYPMTERDRKEFTRMVVEKPAAFAEAWAAIASEMFRAQHQFLTSLFFPLFTTPYRARSSRRSRTRLIDKALAPIHRKATANAKRLAKTKLR